VTDLLAEAVRLLCRFTLAFLSMLGHDATTCRSETAADPLAHTGSASR
jgi:hypothetical protein